MFFLNITAELPQELVKNLGTWSSSETCKLNPWWWPGSALETLSQVINFDTVWEPLPKSRVPAASNIHSTCRWTPPQLGRICSVNKKSANLMVIIIWHEHLSTYGQWGHLNGKEEKPGGNYTAPRHSHTLLEGFLLQMIFETIWKWVL